MWSAMYSHAYGPACVPAYLPDCQPAYLPICLPAYLAAFHT